MWMVAQLVEFWLVTPEVAGSGPVYPPNIADSPSGKAEDSDSSIRWFDPIIGNYLVVGEW